MKNLLITILMLGSMVAMGQNYRKEFVNASESKSAADIFLKTTENINSGSKPVQVAYKGAAAVISARYLTKIGEKLKVAKEGISLIEKAVLQEPENIEVRLIRLSIQENIPKILNYRKNIEEDRIFISKGVEKLPSGSLKTFVENYLTKK